MDSTTDIQCPACKTKFKVDISKIPEIPPHGIHTTCPKCKAQIPIKVENKPQSSKKEELIIPCPHCGHVNISTKTCVSCGSVFTDEEHSKLSIHIKIDD